MKSNIVKLLVICSICLFCLNLNASEKVPKVIKEGASYNIIFSPMASKKVTIVAIDKDAGWVKVKPVENKGKVKEEWLNINQAIAIQVLEDENKGEDKKE